MASFVRVPLDRLQSATLNALLEEYASRDGTDYGEEELSLERKVADLRSQLEADTLTLVYDGDSETWDLVPAERLAELNI